MIRPVVDREKVGAVARGTAIYHPDRAGVCIAALVGQSCGRSEGTPPRPEVCDTVFEGTLRDAATCTVSVECESADCELSHFDDPCAGATCEHFDNPFGPEVEVGIGEACSMLPCPGGELSCVVRCPPGAFCHGTCQWGAGHGEPCAFAPIGHVPISCRNLGDVCGQSGGGWTCQTVRFKGEPCDTGLGDTCGPGLVCDEDTRRCGGYPTLGEPCRAWWPCAPGLLCLGDDRGGASCQVPLAPGEPCTDNRLCTTGYCDPQSSLCGFEYACPTE